MADSKEQNRLSCLDCQTIGRQLVLAFNPRNMVFIIHFKRLSIMIRAISLMESMSMNSLPCEQALCSYLSKNT